jgi:putative DNA primase/helicase
VLSDGGTGRDSRGFLRRPYVGSRDWVRTDADGAPTVSAANIDLMLERAGAGVRFNEMSTCEVGSGVFTDMSMDQIVQVVHEWCVEFGLQGAQHNTVLKALRYIALENRFHPFEEFLKSIEGTWDGVDRIQQLCDLLPVEHPEMRDFLVRKWLYSIIGAARLMYLGIPGAQPRGVLVLSGQQYAGKTSLLQRLFSNLFPGSEKCFISGRHFSGSTDSRLELLGKLVVELGEIDSTTNKAEASLLKAFLSGEADRLRRPYALDHIEIQRRTVFAGSVNVNYLKDPSGNTRFWSLALTEKLPLDAISSLNMKQLWAQVDQQCLEKWPHRGNGSRCWTPWHLTDEEMAIVESANEPHRVLPVEEVWLEDVFDWADPEHKSLMERYRQGDSVAKAELLRLNPMTNLQIIQMAGEIGRRARSNEAFAAPIRKRLGINKMLTKAYTKDNGKRSSQTVWPMPPLTEQGKLMVTGVPIGTTLVQPDGARIH